MHHPWKKKRSNKDINRCSSSGTLSCWFGFNAFMQEGGVEMWSCEESATQEQETMLNYQQSTTVSSVPSSEQATQVRVVGWWPALEAAFSDS